jgi:hypothetical protein
MSQIKNIRDYLPFYIGATCIADGNQFILTGVAIDEAGTCAFDGTYINGIPQAWWVENCDFKLALHPATEINSGEYIIGIFFATELKDPEESAYALCEMTKSLCSKQYDVFGLIKSGLAIDINTLNSKHENDKN